MGGGWRERIKRIVRVGVGLIFAVVGLVILCLLVGGFLFNPVLGIVRREGGVVSRRFTDTGSARRRTCRLGNGCRSTLGSTGSRSVHVMGRTGSRTGMRTRHVMGSTGARTNTVLSGTGTSVEARRRGTVGTVRDEITRVTLSTTSGVVKRGGDDRRSLSLCSRFVGRTNSSGSKGGRWLYGDVV